MRDLQLFLKKLADEGTSLAEELERSRHAPDRQKLLLRQYHRWRKNVIEVLRFAKLESYLREVSEILSRIHASVDWKAGQVAPLLESAVDLLERGFVGNLKILLHAELFATAVDQARALYDGGHLVPAAVLARIVVEEWLKDEAEKAGVQIPKNAKASTMNDRLKDSGVFSIPKWRQVQVYLDIGNAAAHGKLDELTPDDVARLLAFAEANYA